jgi:hypothetical protein
MEQEELDAIRELLIAQKNEYKGGRSGKVDEWFARNKAILSAYNEISRSYGKGLIYLSERAITQYSEITGIDMHIEIPETNAEKNPVGHQASTLNIRCKNQNMPLHFRTKTDTIENQPVLVVHAV